MVKKYTDNINFHILATNTVLAVTSTGSRRPSKRNELGERWLWSSLATVVRKVARRAYFIARPVIRPIAYRLRTFLVAEIRSDLMRISREIQAEQQHNGNFIRTAFQNELRDVRETIGRIEMVLDSRRET